jgi:hypothetical protein
LIWLRREGWKPEADRTQYSNPFRYCDAVISPAEPTGTLSAASTGGVHQVGPITLVRRKSMLGRSTAAAALGLDPDKRYGLVQLGAGTIDNPELVVRRAVDAIIRNGLGMVPVVALSPASRKSWSLPDGVRTLEAVFPLAAHLAAFDLGVFAAGYNSVAEALVAGLPSIFVPNTATVTDDQAARARAVAETGLGLVAQSSDDVVEQLCQLLDDDTRGAINERLDSYQADDGADEAAATIAAVITARRVEGLREA